MLFISSFKSLFVLDLVVTEQNLVSLRDAHRADRVAPAPTAWAITELHLQDRQGRATIELVLLLCLILWVNCLHCRRIRGTSNEVSLVFCVNGHWHWLRWVVHRNKSSVRHHMWRNRVSADYLRRLHVCPNVLIAIHLPWKMEALWVRILLFSEETSL